MGFRSLAENRVGSNAGDNKVTLSRVMRSDNRDLFWWSRIPRWACWCTLHCTACVCHLLFFETTGHKNRAASCTFRTITHAMHMQRRKHPPSSYKSAAHKGELPSQTVLGLVGGREDQRHRAGKKQQWTRVDSVGVSVCGETGVLSSRNVSTGTVVPLKLKPFYVKSGGYLKEPNVG